MSQMSELHQTITEYLEQGDNVYRVASVLNVPLDWVESIAAEVHLASGDIGSFVTLNGTPIFREVAKETDICYG